MKSLIEKIFDIQSDEDFAQLALEIFQFQYQNVEFYKKYCDLIKVNPNEVIDVDSIPFLPIEFFKTERIISKDSNEEIIFESSGTTSSERSKHYVASLDLYHQSLHKGFDNFVGKAENLNFFTMLPSYDENPRSSLIHMLNELLNRSTFKMPQAFDGNLQKLISDLLASNQKDEQSILFGVSFALLDLADSFDVELPNTIIIETGGMKGRRKEITREELHLKLQKKLRPKSIISEYGMTELLSQGYSLNGALFQTPRWMKILIRDSDDPFSIKSEGSGAINVIDLSNVYSCSFLATSDLGRLYEGGGFEVLGRFDHSDIRGCNLLYEMS